MNDKYDHLVKLLLIGSGGAGKTQLLCRYVDDSFSEIHVPTILDFKIRTIEIGCKIVKVQVWDKGGLERFRTKHNSYRGAHVIGICFDLCDAHEFAEVKYWKQIVDRYAAENVPVFVIGTKCEQFNSICVDFETIKNFCLSHGFQYFESSAKLNINVEDF